MTARPVQRSSRYSFTSSHLSVRRKFSGSWACTHLYFQTGSFTLLGTAPVARRHFKSFTTLAPAICGPWANPFFSSAPALWSM